MTLPLPMPCAYDVPVLSASIALWHYKRKSFGLMHDGAVAHAGWHKG